MIETEVTQTHTEDVMIKILEQLLAEDANITARAVARLHPFLAAASSITRNTARMALLSKFQEQQATFRKWSGRVSKISASDQSAAIAGKELRIAELEAEVYLLTISHVAMIRAVGEHGGFSRWAQFYADYSTVRDSLVALGALPKSSIDPLESTHEKSQSVSNESIK